MEVCLAGTSFEVASSTDCLVEVVKFEHEGTEYLKAADGILYDPETQDAVGVWNEATKTIDELDDEED